MRHRTSSTGMLLGLATGTFLFLHVHPFSHPAHGRTEVVAYAKQQIGKPYVWAAAGPWSFDCSGLTQRAYAAQGIGIPRTSQEQWADGPRTDHPRRGDLVFFAGADGTASDPGHVGIYLGPHKMIDAYGLGTVVRVEGFGTRNSAPGLQDVIGYTDP